MQSESCDLQFRACSMKVKLEAPGKQASMAPSRSQPRCASELADPPSPFRSNPAHHPVSLPTTPSGLSYAAKAGAGSPPSTPGKAKSKPTTPAAAMAAYYASQWSPRRLMQRAARAFRSSRSRRVRSRDVAGEERGSSPTKVADTVNLGGGGGASESELARNDGNGVAAAGAQQQQQEEEERHDHPDVVPEKIIHEMSHHHAPPVVAEDECGAKTAPAEDECGAKAAPAEDEYEAKTAPAAEEEENEKETAAAAAATEEVESPKKAPAPEPVAAAAAEEVADKFVAVVKEAIRKHEEEQGEKKGAARKFQGSRVRTAMEVRAESEQPRRRDATPRSNDVIEEARSKLLEMRQCSRVRALVGAFETVMDSNKDAAAAGTPRQHCRRSA